MRLSDIMSHMNLTLFPEVAMVLFLGVFAVVVWRVYRRRGAAELESHAALPLDDCPAVDGTTKASPKP